MELWDICTLGVAILSIFLSLISLYLQFKKGKLVISKIKCIGIIIESTLEIKYRSLICVMPILFYNTGNGYIGISDVRLKMNLNGHQYFPKFNQFVVNLGFDQNGSPKLPDVIDWAHQLIISPKNSILHYIQFYLREDRHVFDKIELDSRLEFDLEVKTSSNSRFRSYQKFKLKYENESQSNYSKYNLYEIEHIK